MRLLLLTALLGALVLTPSAAAWTWPTQGDLLQPFSFDPSRPYAAGQHRGIDVAGAAPSLSASDVNASAAAAPAEPTPAPAGSTASQEPAGDATPASNAAVASSSPHDVAAIPPAPAPAHP